MRQINSLTLEIGDVEKEFQLSEGAIFHGLQVKQHQIMIWVSEIAGAPKDHIVSISNIIEYGSFDEDWVYIGYCSNDLYSEDETYHVVAHSNTMAISVVPLESFVANAIMANQHAIKQMQEEIKALKAKKPPGRPPKETTDAKASA